MDNKKYKKIWVTNITSDETIYPFQGVGLCHHRIVCDQTVESSGSMRTQVIMHCSNTEYESIMENGYFYVEDMDG